MKIWRQYHAEVNRLAIVLGSLLAFSVLADQCAAQAKSEAASLATYQFKVDAGYGFEFDDDPLNAAGFGPNGAAVRVRPAPARTTLIRPRTSFVPEMLKSVENLITVDDTPSGSALSDSLTPSGLNVSKGLTASALSSSDDEGFLESETFIYIDHNGDGQFPYSPEATAFDPSDPDVYLWNITGLDWYKDSADSVILTGQFLSNLPTLPEFLSISLPASQFRDDFMASTYTPSLQAITAAPDLAGFSASALSILPTVDRLPFTLTLDYGVNGGVSVWEANGVLWPIAVPEPSTFGLLGLAVPLLLARAIRRQRRGLPV